MDKDLKSTKKINLDEDLLEILKEIKNPIQRFDVCISDPTGLTIPEIFNNSKPEKDASVIKNVCTICHYSNCSGGLACITRHDELYDKIRSLK